MNWRLTTMLAATRQVTHPLGGTTSASESRVETRGGFASEAACQAAGQRWMEAMRRQRPAAHVTFSCRPG